MTGLTAAAPTVPAQLFGSGLIGLREGLEAGIVVMVLVAFLVKSQRRDALKWVWGGVAAAVAMTVGVFLVIQFGTYTVKDLAAEAIAGPPVEAGTAPSEPAAGLPPDVGPAPAAGRPGAAVRGRGGRLRGEPLR